MQEAPQALLLQQQGSLQADADPQLLPMKRAGEAGASKRVPYRVVAAKYGRDDLSFVMIACLPAEVQCLRRVRHSCFSSPWQLPH